MNILNIAIKQLKQDFRQTRTLIFMIAFPIILMLVLGTALSSTFTSTVPIGDIHVLYQNNASNEVSQYFDGFVKEVSKANIHFEKVDGLDGKKAVKEHNDDGYVEITNDGVKLFVNDQNSIKASIIQGMLSTFVDKYNVAFVVAKAGAIPTSALKDHYMKETSLHAAKQPGSMDYYAIAMLTMIALYGAINASFLLRGERLRKTADRLIAAPIRKGEIFLGKVFGSIITNSLGALILIFFSKFVFHVHWGDHLGLVFLVVFTEILLATSIGLGLSYMTKSDGATTMILMIFAQVASFFGGAYFKIEHAHGFLGFVTKLSPLTWENAAITKIIYANDLLAAIPTITLNFGVSVLFFLIAIISFQRREGL